MSGQQRIPELDGVRGIAILLVLLHHLTVLEPVGGIDRYFADLAHLGWCGVELFFVLSGFLITGILLAAKEDGRGYFRNFYARRTLRIFPLYYAVVAFSLLVLPKVAHPKVANFARISGDEWAYWTYLSNVTIGLRGLYRHGILDVSWSLAIEEQFYILWPLVVFLCTERALQRVCVAVVAAAILFRTALFVADAPFITINVLTPGRLDALAIGALSALRARRGMTGLIPRRSWVRVLLTMAAFLSVVSATQHDAEARPGQIFGYTIVALAFAALVERAAGGSSVLRWRFLRWFGKYSYAIYLFHLPIRAAVRDLLYGPSRFLMLAGSKIPGQLLFYVVSTLLAALAAFASWHLFEKHFLRLKRYFEPERRSNSPERMHSAMKRSDA